MRSKEIENYKKTLSLSKRQRSILVGLLLGDGHLETHDGRIYRLKVEHSLQQKEYLEWLYQEFKNLVRTAPQIKKRKNGKDSYWFNTYSLGSFRFYGQQFYTGRKKVVPKTVQKLLDPLALAIWFMDDGSWKSDNHRTYIIHTVGYAENDLKKLQQVLQDKFGITVGIHKQYTNWRLCVTAESAKKFAALIEPYIVPSLKYKLGNTMPKK